MRESFVDMFQINQLMNVNTTLPFKTDNKQSTSLFSDFDFKLLLQSKINEAVNLNQNVKTEQPVHQLPFSQMTTMNNHFIQTPIQPINKSLPKTDFNSIVKQAAEKFNVDEKLIHSVIKMESNYKPNATSRAGAQGLMQLMPQTARGLGVKNAYDPKQNIFGGTKYLRQMLNQFNGNVKLALAAYNAGPGNVKKYGGIPPFTETQNYVKNILNNYLT